MSTRADTMAQVASPKRLAAAFRAASDLDAFTTRLSLPSGPEAVLLYLTQLQASGASGHRLRHRLQLLDTARRLQGEEAWGADRDVRRLLRGLHQSSPLVNAARGHPLYRELVNALVDAINSPTHDQRRWRTAILLANATGASSRSLTTLSWSDLTIRPAFIRIDWLDAGRRTRGRGSIVTREQSLETYEALVDLWTHATDRSLAVFASTYGKCDYQQMWRTCRVLPAHSRGTTARRALRTEELEPLLAKVGEPSARQIRDRALVLVGFWAALRTSEAVAATNGWFRQDARGLLIDIPLRREIVAVPALDDTYCPLRAWNAWQDRLRSARLDGDLCPAFPQISGSRIWTEPMCPARLNITIGRRCEQAGLDGDHKVHKPARRVDPRRAPSRAPAARGRGACGLGDPRSGCPPRPQREPAA